MKLREREAVVEVEKKRVETKEPIIIEAPDRLSLCRPKVEKRIERERQVPLFPEAVEGGLLPPLRICWSQRPDSRIASARKSLEYTSRLIERKLAADLAFKCRCWPRIPGR